MTATADRSQRRGTPDDLALWYETFEKLAATSPVGGRFFHGPHVGAPVGLDRVREGLAWLEREHGDELKENPLPTVAQMLAAMTETPEPPGPGTRHSGSPCHNLWHWFHG